MTMLKTNPEERTDTCHGPGGQEIHSLPTIAIVGSPNVGKSVLFHALTGIYATVSNYPGTTVEVMRGKGQIDGYPVGVMDTPGMYTLRPITEEERVARRILLEECPALVIHVIDAKNIERMLPMTLQLIEADLPVILVVNLLDESERLGLNLKLGELQQALGVPVVGTALVHGRGLPELLDTIAKALNPSKCSACKPIRTIPVVQHPPAIKEILNGIENGLSAPYTLSRRSLAVLLLQGDDEIRAQVLARENGNTGRILAQVDSAQARFSQPLALILARRYRLAAQQILDPVIEFGGAKTQGFSSRLSDWLIRPLTGVPALLVVLFLLYEFVGVFGAQILVGWMEETLFGTWINPWVDRILAQAIPWAVLRELIGGEFGILTLGVRYAVAIVLPIVGTFFLAFSVIEDSGYLPRLALLIDRTFKKIGLNGRAVIPMVLGFGCDTMATIVTRTLETRRERVISTLLLSLAIPCSAQLGVMMALLGIYPAMAAGWVAVVVGIFLLVGYLAAQLMPGEKPAFYMELPPLRLPTVRNVIVKTTTRMEWYLREVIPLFIAASVVIWLGQISGLFDLALRALQPVVTLLGLPQETALAFLFGFFRRDYGAAGLYDIRHLLKPGQLLVAVTTMTLFVPCVAQFAVTVKERGWKTALAIAGFIIPFSFAVGGGMHLILSLFGIE